MYTTITRRTDNDDSVAEMLRTALADVQPRGITDLLDLAGLVGEVDGGHVTAQTIGGGVR